MKNVRIIVKMYKIFFGVLFFVTQNQVPQIVIEIGQTIYYFKALIKS